MEIGDIKKKFKKSTLNILLQTKENKKRDLWHKNESNAGTRMWEMHQQQFLKIFIILKIMLLVQ